MTKKESTSFSLDKQKLVVVTISIAHKCPDLVTPLYIEAPLEKPLLFL
jgi:hypothetical protein